MATQLPIYKIKGKFYFLDKRLNEYRNVKNPFDMVDYFNAKLQTPTIRDSKKIFEEGENILKKKLKKLIRRKP
jgi:hypothetical protein